MADGKFLMGKPSGGVTTVTVADGATNTNLVLPESGTVSGVTTAVTDNAIARFDGTTGKLQNSGVTIDDNGNIGVGVIPSGNYKAEAPNNYTGSFKFGYLCGGTSGSSYSSVGFNFRTTVTDSTYLYDRSDTSSMIRFDSGGFKFFTAPIGTIENTISYTQAMTLNDNGNLLLTSGTGALGYGTGAGGIVTQLTSKDTGVTLNKPSGRITMHTAALAAGASASFSLFNNLMTGNDLVLLGLSGGYSNSHNYRLEARQISTSGVVIRVTNISASSLSEALVINFAVIKGVIS